MKAILCENYGPPEALQLSEAEKPAPKENEVLVRVFAASANPADWHLIVGGVARFFGGLRKPRDPRSGIDLAGKVEAVGSGVTRFKPGDEVFGGGAGSFAEYAIARENGLAPKPAGISFEAAAAVPVAAMTAVQGLRAGKIHAGQKVLVNGASGGVGTFAVQIAKSYGTEVTGVCSTRNLDLVRSIGAEHAIDYTQEDFSRNGQRYDLIFDAVGNHSIADLKRALNPHGMYVIVGFAGVGRLFEHMVMGPILSLAGTKKAGSMGMAKINNPDLVFMKELLEAGKVVAVIDRRYPLAETGEALRYLMAGHARGKVIISVQPDGKS